MGRAVFPPNCLIWSQTMVEVIEIMVTSFKRSHVGTDALSDPNAEKAREFQKKTSTFALLTMPKSLTVWITTNYGKFLKRWEYQTTWPASWEICMQEKKQQSELDMEQQTGSK